MFLLVYVEYKNNCTQINTGTPSFVLYTVSNVIFVEIDRIKLLWPECLNSIKQRKYVCYVKKSIGCP